MQEKVAFPILVGEMAKRRIKKKQVQELIGVGTKTLYNKLNGTTPFYLREAGDSVASEE